MEHDERLTSVLCSSAIAVRAKGRIAVAKAIRPKAYANVQSRWLRTLECWAS